jgi:hypothetical protein
MNYSSNIYSTQKDRLGLGQPNYLQWMGDNEDKHFIVQEKQVNGQKKKEMQNMGSILKRLVTLENGVIRLEMRDLRILLLGFVVGVLICKLI